jgi:hypothetical protein
MSTHLPDKDPNWSHPIKYLQYVQPCKFPLDKLFEHLMTKVTLLVEILSPHDAFDSFISPTRNDFDDFNKFNIE